MSNYLPLSKFIIIFFLLNSSFNLLSQIEPSNKSTNWETWYDHVPVSGEIRVGLMSNFEDIRFNPVSFFASIPKEKEDKLCVEISSRDGRYNANLEYDISSINPGIQEFKWPTHHNSKLMEFTGKDVTILCSISNDCEGDPFYYAVASWDREFNSDSLVVLLNTEKFPVISILDKKTKNKQDFKCKKLSLSNLTTYNCKCVIPKNAITNDSEIKINQRIRRLNRITYKKYSLSIKI